MLDWLKIKLVGLLGPGWATSIARHLGSAAAGVFGGAATSWEEVIGAILIYILAQGLSFAERKRVAPIPVAKDEKVIAITTLPKHTPPSVGVNSPLATTTEIPAAKQPVFPEA